MKRWRLWAIFPLVHHKHTIAHYTHSYMCFALTFVLKVCLPNLIRCSLTTASPRVKNHTWTIFSHCLKIHRISDSTILKVIHHQIIEWKLDGDCMHSVNECIAQTLPLWYLCLVDIMCVQLRNSCFLDIAKRKKLMCFCWYVNGVIIKNVLWRPQTLRKKTTWNRQ